MVEKIHYRWDFIGLSTDTKPTPATNDRVANGSTFYCSDTSKLYVWYKDQWYEKTVSGGGGGTSNFNELSNRPKYNGTAMTGDTNIPEVVTYSNFTGTDGTAAGTSGLVPAPATTDAGKFLKADGTWDTAGGGSGPTVVQTTGTSTTDVMSQDATSKMIFPNPSNKNAIEILTSGSTSESHIKIGYSNSASGSGNIAIGNLSQAGSSSLHTDTIAIGNGAQARAKSAIALGNGATTSTQGVFAIGGANTFNTGYNNSRYRLLTGLYDPQSAHDAATKQYVDNKSPLVNIESVPYNFDPEDPTEPDPSNPTAWALWKLANEGYTFMYFNNNQVDNIYITGGSDLRTLGDEVTSTNTSGLIVLGNDTNNGVVGYSVFGPSTTVTRELINPNTGEPD